MKVGGDCLKYLKRGWNRKEGMGHKDFKKEKVGKLREEVSTLKRGVGTPLRTMAQDGGPCHGLLAVRRRLNQLFGERVLSLNNNTE